MEGSRVPLRSRQSIQSFGHDHIKPPGPSVLKELAESRAIGHTCGKRRADLRSTRFAEVLWKTGRIGPRALSFENLSSVTKWWKAGYSRPWNKRAGSPRRITQLVASQPEEPTHA
jgi:hypothetical protein